MLNSVAQMERLRFFQGQLLSAQDFQTEQQYHMEKRRLHNRMLHGFGVADGLAVAMDGSGTAVLISPGLALDPRGNEILVESPVRIDLGVSTSDVCFVVIEFTETASDPVPGPNGAEFSRVKEGYAVSVALEDPPVGLARLIRVEGRWIVDETYCRRSVR
jgi:hypothetical protein